VLAAQIPRTGKLEHMEMFNRQNFELFRAFLEAHRHEIRSVNLELAAFVCVTSIEALTHNAVLHQTGDSSGKAFEALTAEAVRLVFRYLQ
jgi:Tetracyclin repressor-like, C-terminal domain